MRLRPICRIRRIRWNCPLPWWLAVWPVMTVAARVICLAWLLPGLCMAGTAPAAALGWRVWGDIVFRHYNAQNGLPSSGTTAMAQDGNGFLWIGTQDGLVRWDGYRFRLYLPQAGNPNSLSDNYIQTLYTDRQGRLWIGTLNGGLLRHEPETDGFVRYGSGQGGVPGWGVVNSVLEVSSGKRMLVATGNGVRSFDPAGGPIAHMRAGEKIGALLQARDDTVWLASGRDLYAAPARTDVTRATGSPIRFASDIYCLFQASDGAILVGTRRNGAFRLARGATQPQALPGELEQDWIAAFAEPLPGQLWVATATQGIAIIEAHGVRRLRHDPLLVAGLPMDAIEALLVDRSGLVWVATHNGISVHYPQSGILTMYGVQRRAEQGIGKGMRSVLANRDGTVWLGLDRGGVQILDPLKVSSRTLPLGPDAASNSLHAAPVMALSQAADGSVYLGTGRGVFRVAAPPAQAAPQHATAKPATAQTAPPQRIEALDMSPRDNTERTTSVLADGDTLWVGSNRDGLWRRPLNPASASERVRVPLTDQRIVGLDLTAPGRLWIATQNGLNLWQPPEPDLLRFVADAGSAHGLSSSSVVTTLQDRRGRIWIGTSGAGLNVLLPEALPNRPGSNTAATRFVRIGVEQGLPNGVINKILEDRDGHIWVSTDNGLAKIDGQSWAVRALGLADGVALPTYWANSGAITQNGELLFGALGGLTVIQPWQLPNWTYQPPLAISEIRIGGKPLGGRPLGGPSTELILSPEQNQLSVEVSALDFSAPHANRYRHRLADGSGRWLEPDWTDTDAAHRQITYANLPPGQYQLHLRGSNRLGQFGKDELRLPFRVLPAWYQSWWWYVIVISAMACAVLALVQLRTRSLRRQRHALEQQVLRRTEQLEQKQAQLLEANQSLQLANQELAATADSLRQAQTQLVQQEKLAALGGLVAGVSHELNTPLGVALSAIDGARNVWLRLQQAWQEGKLAKSALEKFTAEGLEFTELAQNNSQRAADLVNHFKLITVDLTEGGEVALALGPYLHDLADLYAHDFAAQGYRFEVAIAADLPVLTLVPEALGEALQRILGNVRDHAFGCEPCGEPCCVRLSAWCDAQRVYIRVGDNGHGIAGDAIHKVFDPFFSTKTGSGRHIGLGLHIAYNQVTHRLKGQLRIDSVPGQGTELTICLPRPDRPAES